MFISHLTFFISSITVFLFILRIKNKTFSEIILILFAFQSFFSSLLWLYINYYNSDFNIIVDYFGIINENIILIYSSLFVYYIHKKIPISRRIQILIITFLISVFLFYLHFLIKKNSNYIFYPSNENVTYNLFFQIIIDIILLFVFVMLFRKKINDVSNELFDGNFRKYILIGFLFYFIQDLLILILLLLAVKKVILPEYLMNLSNILSLITTISLLMSAIYTNWLKEYNTIRLLNKNLKLTPENIDINKIFELKNIDWVQLKELFYNDNELLFDTIENKNLSKTEKIYAFFDHLDISHKDLSNLLNVSVRTIETNFYRTRRKLNQ